MKWLPLLILLSGCAAPSPKPVVLPPALMPQAVQSAASALAVAPPIVRGISVPLSWSEANGAIEASTNKVEWREVSAHSYWDGSNTWSTVVTNIFLPQYFRVNNQGVYSDNTLLVRARDEVVKVIATDQTSDDLVNWRDIAARQVFLQTNVTDNAGYFRSRLDIYRTRQWDAE